MSELDGKSALVTGAARGLGKACAIKLAREGAQVAVVDLDLDACKDVVSNIEDDGGRAIAIAADICDANAVIRMVNETTATLGALDLAVNNAGISNPSKRLGDFDDEEWDRVFAVNSRGVYLCMKHQLREMEGSGTNAAIVNISSTAGLQVQIGGVAPYAASKASVIGMTKAAARDYAPKIRINAVCPGYMRTMMNPLIWDRDTAAEERTHARIPLRRVSDPAEVAELVSFLLSERASFITGQAVIADGGQNI